MTEQIEDTRKVVYTAVPYFKVVRLQEHPYEGKRWYCVMQKMIDADGNYAGWRHESKGYEHSTSAYAAMGRLVQKHIHDNNPELPSNER